MSNEFQIPEPNMENEISGNRQDVVSATPKKSNKKLFIIIGIVLVFMCICTVLCVVLYGAGIGKVAVENAPVEAVLDKFMQDMEVNDVESAFALFSPYSKTSIQITDLEKMNQGNNYILFEGYESLSVQSLNLSAEVDNGQGTLAEVEGVISYAGDYSGQFDGVLEKVDGTWMIQYINVYVPPGQ